MTRQATSNPSRMPLVGGALGAAAVVLALGLFGASEHWLEKGLATALDRLPAVVDTGRDVKAAQPPGFDPMALRLSRHELEPAVGVSADVPVGESITLAIAGGPPETLEVVSITELPIDPTRMVGSAAAPTHVLKLVTARSGAGPNARTVRLVLEVEVPAVVLPPTQKPRTL